jgi:hypothetical protein
MKRARDEILEATEALAAGEGNETEVSSATPAPASETEREAANNSAAIRRER